jgi:cellulose synthase operon protein C
MKKIIIAVIALILVSGGAFLIRQNLPTKRYARHLIKARLFAKEKNYTAAKLEYELAFNATDGYTPYASLEVLEFTNQMNLEENKLADAYSNTAKFLELHPENKEARLSLARLAFRTGDIDRAFESIREILKRDADYFPARMLLTEVRSKQGRLDLAEEQLRYLYKVYPDSLATLLPMAENMLRQGRVPEAREFIQAALTDHPGNNNAKILLLDSYLMDGRVDSAQNILDAWLKSDSTLILPIRLRKAQIQAMAGRFEAAESTLAPYLEEREENVPTFMEMALVHAKQGRYDSAVANYLTAEELAPAKAGKAMLLRAYLNLKAGSPAKALETLKTLNIQIKEGEVISLLAVSLVALGQEGKLEQFQQELPDTLKPRIKALVDAMPSDKEYIGQWALVNYYSMLRQPQYAAGAIEELYKKWPKNKMALTLWSTQLAASRKYAEAAKILEQIPDRNFPQEVTLVGLYVRARQDSKVLPLAERLLRENPKTRGINLFLGDYWMSHGSKAKSVGYMEAEIALDPDNVVALNNLAWEYGIVQGNLEKAKPFLEKLKSKKALDPRILDTIGWVLFKNGQGQDAEGYFLTALNLVPDHPSFQFHYAKVLEQLGKRAESRKYLEAALASKLPFEERKEAESLLATGG